MLTNNIFITAAPPWHVFCFSYGEFEVLKERWASYDACVEIMNTYLVPAAIWNSGTINGVAVNTLAPEILMHPVSYTYRDRDISLEDPAPPDIFTKAPSFARDKEVRIAIDTSRQQFGDAVFIDVPLGSLVRRIDL